MEDSDAAREARLEALRRDSGIVLGIDGDFRYQGTRVAHPRVQNLFHAGIELRPGGDVTMRVGRWWCYVTCEGPAFFVESISRRETGAWIAHLKGGRELLLAGASFGYASDHDRLYLWTEEILGPVLLLRAAHQAALIVMMDDAAAWFDAGCAGWGALPTFDARCILLSEAPRAPDTPVPEFV